MCRDARGQRDVADHLVVVHPADAARSHEAPDTLGHGPGALQPGRRQQNRELLAAVTGDAVAPLHAGLERLADGADHAVAEEVAVPVVDALEVVDVGHDDAELLPLGDGIRDHGGDPFVEGAAVQQAGEAVEQGLLADAHQFPAQFLDLLGARGQAFVHAVHDGPHRSRVVVGGADEPRHLAIHGCLYQLLAEHLELGAVDIGLAAGGRRGIGHIGDDALQVVTEPGHDFLVQIGDVLVVEASGRGFVELAAIAGEGVDLVAEPGAEAADVLVPDGVRDGMNARFLAGHVG